MAKHTALNTPFSTLKRPQTPQFPTQCNVNRVFQRTHPLMISCSSLKRTETGAKQGCQHKGDAGLAHAHTHCASLRDDKDVSEAAVDGFDCSVHGRGGETTLKR